MKSQDPIKNAQAIHFNQVLFNVVTSPYENIKEEEILKKTNLLKALRHAEVRRMKVKAISCNESETALLIQGLLVDKDGNPIKTKDPKGALIEDLKIPFDQENVVRQPGVWFDTEEDAQSFAKDLNSAANLAAGQIKKAIEDIMAFNAELIDSGC